MQADKGLFGALFDFSFSSFITTKLIKILYILAIAAAAVAALGLIANGFTEGFVAGIGYTVVAVLMFLIYVITARVWLELVIVVFRISENVARIAETKTTKSVPPTTPPPGGTP